MDHTMWLRLWLTCAFALGTLLVPPEASDVSHQPSMGVLTVTTTKDNSLWDTHLSLREALRIANGDLTKGFSPFEQLLMGGCIFNGAGDIIGGCGGGIVDIIRFDASLGYQPVFTITGELPHISDTAYTDLQGDVNNVFPIINAAGAGYKKDGLTITSDSNAIYGVTIINAPRDGFRITGNSNYISSMAGVRASQRHGIMIDGASYTLIQGAYIGVTSLAPYACAGNSGSGVVITNTAQNTTLRHSVVGCNNDGVSINNAISSQIGPNASIGMSAADDALGNTHAGVRINGGSSNAVVTSTLHYNQIGIVIEGTDAVSNVVRASVIRNNTLYGVLLNAGAQYNTLGGSFAQGNLISANPIGVVISDTHTSFNALYGNCIGTDASGTLADGNSISGIRIIAAAHNNIGAGSGERNLISGNGIGVWLEGATNNKVQGNYIGVTLSRTAPVPNGTGVLLSDGAHSNMIGGSAAGNSNVIAGNLTDGVRISGTDTTSNTVALNSIGLDSIFVAALTLGQHRIPTSIALPNLGHGIALLHGAHDNAIGDGNTIAYNGANGIYLASGAQHNTISASYAFSNAVHGIAFDDEATSFNILMDTVAHSNGVNGIAEGNSASVNTWRAVSVYGNGALGINQETTSTLIQTPHPPANFRIISASQTTGVVHGIAEASDAVTVTVDLYRLALDPSSFGEGIALVGSASTNSSGNWTITDPNPAASHGCYTAVVRTATADGESASEFARSSCAVFAPSIWR